MMRITAGCSQSLNIAVTCLLSGTHSIAATITKIRDRDIRREKLAVSKPRPEVFILWGIQKPITFVHIFRLAESLAASVLLVHTSMTKEVTDCLNEFFPRWKTVPHQACSGPEELAMYLKESCLRPIALEMTDKAKPYWAIQTADDERLAFIVGSEVSGIDESELDLIPDHAFVPMAGDATCLSAGMALAVVAFHFAYVSRDAE